MGFWHCIDGILDTVGNLSCAIGLGDGSSGRYFRLGGIRRSFALCRILNLIWREDETKDNTMIQIETHNVHTSLCQSDNVLRPSITMPVYNKSEDHTILSNLN
jgi:hypothetical protein